MLESLILAAGVATITPVIEPRTAPAVIVNRWRDSGHPEVWRDVPRWIRDLGLCIRKHESMHSGHYRAKNPASTASGAYQMINSTWLGNARWVTIARKYPTAKAAPAHVQDAVFIHSIRHGGIDNWRGTDCPGTG